MAEREDTGREEVLRALAPCGARVTFLEMPMIEVSSSQVRERVHAGEPIEGLVEPAVAGTSPSTACTALVGGPKANMQGQTQTGRRRGE